LFKSWINERITNITDYFALMAQLGDRGGTVFKALCYKSEGRWFDVIGIFH